MPRCTSSDHMFDQSENGARQASAEHRARLGVTPRTRRPRVVFAPRRARACGTLRVVAKKARTRLETWKPAPDLHDFPAAASYLSLLLPDATAAELADRLRTATTAYWKAKDLLRASGLTRLPETDVHVAGDLRKVARGEQLSPVLLDRGSATAGR